METTSTDILVGLLTVEEKEQLVGQQYAPDSYFNPVQDNSDNWIISIEEIQDCTNQEFMWVQTLELIPFVPKPLPIPIPPN